MSEAKRKPNRLINETSVYLRQHAMNPVDWYPWGEEALRKAREEDRPILLSIGYSACHWCHVMERESFEDEAIAGLMNAHFVNIKVDRETRPDLDQIYQTVVQLLRHSGGWPLTVFLTPSCRPFYAGTYFPPKPRHGLPSFGDLLVAIRDAYDHKREDVVAQADEITRAVGEVTAAAATSKGGRPGQDLLERASRKLTARFDDEHGGFGSRPKFPNTMCVEVLLRQAWSGRDAQAEARVRRALDGMRAGGIWDHLGGGFHRYSTDEKWLVPHFEKMLYDNAQLARLYTDASRAFQAPGYAQVARDIGGYLLREMTSPQGAFYAAQDADSEGEEGKFFVWKPDEVDAIIEDPTTRTILKMHLDISPGGNFERTGATVLSDAVSLDRISLKLGLPPSEVQARVAQGKEALLAARERRPRPLRDEKMLVCWNGLTIGALAELGAATGEARWLDAAKQAFHTIATHALRGGRVDRYLAHRGDGEVQSFGPGFLDDHANLGNAALDLYEATAEASYVTHARAIADDILARFRGDGGFYFTPSDGESLIVRARDAHDQATPSGASMASLLLLRLGSLVGGEYGERAAEFLEAHAAAALDNPFGMGQMLCALHRLVKGSIDVVIVGEPGLAATEALRRVVLEAYLPCRTLAVIHDEASRQAASALAEGKVGRQGEAVAYVCRGTTCSAPTSDPQALRDLLREAH